jgi:hypothetical protein
MRTHWIEGFESTLTTIANRFRGDSGINLVKQCCEQVESALQVYLAKDITKAEHDRMIVLADALKAKYRAENLVTAPDFGKWLGV